MKAAEEEVPDAHFIVDKQNISLWPRDSSSKTDQPLLLRKSTTICATLIFLALVLATSVLLQAFLFFSGEDSISMLGTCTLALPMVKEGHVDRCGRSLAFGHNIRCKTKARLLKGRVDNISSLGPEIKTNSDGVEAASTQIQAVNVNLDHVRSQILTVETGLEKANAQIQRLTRSWEKANDFYAQIPELKKDLDKATVLNAKVRELQNSLDNFSKMLNRQNDILQMVSQGWKYFNGNFYYFSHIPKTWYSAQQFCISKESRLTSVISESEQEFLYKTANGVSHWIGLTKAGSEGNWYWVDYTPFDKVQSTRFWIPGEPNNAGNNEHCANIKTFSLRSWNDDSCDIKLLFICKRPYIPSEP